jgi:replicative superfamily II helicase
LLAKIRAVEKLLSKPNHYQIVSMSATLSGLDKLKEWLDTEVFECQFRPVPLSEYLQVGCRLMDKNLRTVVDFSQLPKLDTG